MLATVLTLTRAFSLPASSWWTPLVQAHGHLQLFGRAGLFVLGVALHFLPRLRGSALALPRLVPWLLGALVSGLLLRASSQPLLAITGMEIWCVLLVISGALECVALAGVVALLAATALRGPALATRQAFQGILPFMVMAFGSLGLASVINLVNVIQAASSGLVPPANDDLNVTLGLLGFLVPMALAMSARSLPMYSGLEAFPQKLVWPLAITYFLGLVLICTGTMVSASWAGVITGGGMTCIGIVVILFVGVFLQLMRSRGRLPRKVAELAPESGTVARSYRAKVTKEGKDYGPFVLLVASAYMWAVLGGMLLMVDGVTQLVGGDPIGLALVICLAVNLWPALGHITRT